MRDHLAGHAVPAELTTLYEALRESSGKAMASVLDGENEIQKEWRKASRLGREFLAATEEPAQLALVSELGDWESARTTLKPPAAGHHTFVLWLAAMAWRLLRLCMDDDADYTLIQPVRDLAREGIIAIKTAPSLERVLAQRVVHGETRVEDRERGPKLEPAGQASAVRLQVVQ